MKRGKRLGPGKKTVAKRQAMASALLHYFDRFGWIDAEGYRVAPCQISGDPMRLEDAHAHHKTPRSEMRKAGHEDLDAPPRLLICHYLRHLQFIHKGEMGRPKEADAARRFSIAEQSPANALDGGLVAWEGQDRMNLDRLAFRRF